MFGMIEDIEDYNRRFKEETKCYKKFCKGKECQYADECEKQGYIVFCERDDKRKILHYIKGRSGGGIFSFKDMCRKDDFPKDGMDMKMLNELWKNAEKKFPEILPNSIDVWIAELKEMGMFKE